MCEYLLYYTFTATAFTLECITLISLLSSHFHWCMILHVNVKVTIYVSYKISQCLLILYCSLLLI